MKVLKILTLLLIIFPHSCYLQIIGKTFCSEKETSSILCITFDNHYFGTIYETSAEKIVLDTVDLGGNQLLISYKSMGEVIRKYDFLWLTKKEIIYLTELSHHLLEPVTRSEAIVDLTFLYNSKMDELYLGYEGFITFHRFIGMEKVGNFIVIGK